MIARRVIEAARDRNAAFVREKHPDPVALRFLSDYHRDLFGKVADRNPSIVAETLEIAFPFVYEEEDVAFEDGYPLPAHKDVQGGTVHLPARCRPPKAPLVIVAWENRIRPRFPLSAWIHQGRIYFVGIESDWSEVDQVDVEYIPEPDELEAMTSELLIPDGGYLACVEAVAAFFGARQGVDLSGRAASAEDRFLAEIKAARPAQRIPRVRRR